MTISASIATRLAGIDTGDLDLRNVSLAPMPGWMNVALGSSFSAVTLGQRIFVNQDMYPAVASGENRGLLAHELVHVDQWRREGYVAFLVQYTTEYLRNRIIGLDHRTAYRAISFEAAAYDAQRRSAGEIE